MRSLLFALLAVYTSVVLSSSVLLSGGTIIAFDEESQSLNVIRDGALLVTKDRIAQLYHETSPTGLPAGTEIVDCTHKIITPGFIDTHRHGWQTGLKTLGSNTTLLEYLVSFSSPAAGPFYTAEDVYVSQLAGLLEALNAGVTTTLDHAHHLWSTDRAEAGLDASVESGARVYWAAALGSTSGYSIPDQIKDWKRWDSNKFSPDGLVKLGLAYDSWDTGAPADTQAVIKLIKEAKPPVLTLHWLGGVWPGANSPPSLINSYGVLNTTTAVVFSHGAGITSAEAHLLRQTNQFLSITPESEMHYGHGQTFSHQVLDQAALGVDTHFTFSSDMLTQARMWMQRTRSRLYDEVLNHWELPVTNPMSVNQAFLLATRQGALALRRPDLGVISPGAKADLVVFDGRSPGMLGWADPVAAVMLHANVGDMVHVLVDGQFRKREGRLTFENYGDLVERFLASAGRLRQEMLKRPARIYQNEMMGDAWYAHSDYPVEVDILRGEGTGYGSLFLRDDKIMPADAAKAKHDEL